MSGIAFQTASRGTNIPLKANPDPIAVSSAKSGQQADKEANVQLHDASYEVVALEQQDPKEWPSRKKTLNVGMASALVFQMQMGSSIVAPALGQINQHFGVKSEALTSFVISIYVLGLAFDPLVWGPGSEIWGRTIVYHICNVMSVIMIVGCALSTSLGMLLAFRFLTGCFGSVSMALGGGVIADVAKPDQRGKYSAILTVGPIVGPIIGPVIGGFISEAAGWRWCFWLMLIVGGVITALAFALLSESYPPTLLARKAKALRRSTGVGAYHSPTFNLSDKESKFTTAISRPLRMLAFCPVALMTAINLALTFSYIYILFTTLPAIFQDQYHFGEGLSGVAYIAVGIGDVTGIIICSILSDRVVKWHEKRTGVRNYPEARLVLLLAILPLLPIGLLWYGWAAEAKTPWIVVEIGAVPVGVGIVGSSICAQLYMVDTYTKYAASAMAATAFLRSIAGAFIPLAGRPLYSALGIGLGNTVLACIALVSCISSATLWRYGKFLREKFPFEREL